MKLKDLNQEQFRNLQEELKSVYLGCRADDIHPNDDDKVYWDQLRESAKEDFYLDFAGEEVPNPIRVTSIADLIEAAFCLGMKIGKEIKIQEIARVLEIPPLRRSA